MASLRHWRNLLNKAGPLGHRLGVHPKETWSEALCNRIVPTLGRHDVVRLVENRAFVFAGRTWKTANPNFGVQPNCAVVPFGASTTQCIENANFWLSRGTGIGVQIPMNVLFNTQNHLVLFLNELGLTAEKFADPTGRVPGIMVCMPNQHSNVLDFITAKSPRNKNRFAGLRHMNISVLYSDRSITTGKTHFRDIAEAAWFTGDPGMLVTSEAFSTGIATAPCGELFMKPNEVCTLGTIYVPRYLQKDNTLDVYGLTATAIEALSALDSVWQKYPRSKWPKGTVDVIDSKRRLGLGIFGLADMFSLMGVRYGSKDSVRMTHAIGQALYDAAGIFRRQNLGVHYESLTACPPTGGIATWLRTSYSIEPHFGDRSVTLDDHLVILMALQGYIENSVSKTVNLPRSFSIAETESLFRFAYYNGIIKGLTVYRDLQCMGC